MLSLSLSRARTQLFASRESFAFLLLIVNQNIAGGIDRRTNRALASQPPIDRCSRDTERATGGPPAPRRAIPLPGAAPRCIYESLMRPSSAPSAPRARALAINARAGSSFGIAFLSLSLTLEHIASEWQGNGDIACMSRCNLPCYRRWIALYGILLPIAIRVEKKSVRKIS
jgi:hypothetical protein